MTVTRGTTNGNARGSYITRAKRRAYLLQEYAADVRLIRVTWRDGFTYVVESLDDDHLDAIRLGYADTEELPTARCYRCGLLLADLGDQSDPHHITVDRIVPGFQGGTYRRTNIRPACGAHNSETGAKARHAARNGHKRPRRPEPKQGGLEGRRVTQRPADRPGAPPDQPGGGDATLN